MAWVKTNPSNDELLVNFPSQCRANWEALELGTDASLLITNAKVHTSAGIVDTKLAQITTASKVSGAALTLLPNIPAGAGLIPIANIPDFDASKVTTGLLAVARGGTNSATQNWVDLTTAQAAIAGNKRFTGTTTLDTAILTTATITMLGGNMDCNNKVLTNLVLGQTAMTAAGGIWYVP